LKKDLFSISDTGLGLKADRFRGRNLEGFRRFNPKGLGDFGKRFKNLGKGLKMDIGVPN